MLILSRRIGEAINIAGHVTVVVLGVKGSQVRLGIAAPQDVQVHREEIYERMQIEKVADVDSVQKIAGQTPATDSKEERGR